VKLLRNPILIVVGLSALAIVLVAGCTDEPQAPNANIPPNTRITNYHISTSPDSAAFYNVTVYWAASDPDGQAEYYRYWIDQANIADSMKTGIYETSVTVRMEYNSDIRTHVFYVQARDDRDVWDPTPAQVQVNIDEVSNVDAYNPETEPVTVPPDGGLTSRGVHFVINGSDIDGSVPSFQRAIDDTTNWVTVEPAFVLSRESTLELDLTPSDLSLGPHVVYVRAVDNFGNIDNSPITISFVAVDTLRPDLSVVSGAIPNAFYFLPQGGTETDVPTTWDADASWYYSTLQYRYAVDDSANWSGWQTESSATLTGLAAGSHQFFVRAKDQAGHITTMITDFGVGNLTGDQGILVVNGIDWGTYPEAVSMYEDNGPFGDHAIHFWDMFSGAQGNYPPNIADVFIGSGAVPGDVMGHYSSAVFVVNNFNGDLDIYSSMLPLIMSYLNGGGNVLLACRFGASFVTGDLLTYGLSDGNSLEFPSDLVNVNPAPSGLVAAVDGLVNITSLGGWTYTDLPLPSDDPAVTTLFTTPDYPNAVGGIIVQPEGKGKFAFIAGREYRFEHTAMATDFGYILTHYFGEQ
jgi:hypothetical protein